MQGRAAQTLRRLAQRGIGVAQGQGGRYRALPALMEAARMDRAAVEALQLERLRAVLGHARQHVPYWRETMGAIGFDERDVQRVSDLDALPEMTRELVREQGDRLISDAFDPSRLLRRSTGGSTAQPLVFRVAPDEYEQQLAVGLRSFALVGVEPGDVVAKLWGYGREQRAGNLLAPLTGRLYLDAFHLEPDIMDGWIDAMRRTPPRMLYGYASAVHELARYIERRGVRLPSLVAVCTTAEKLFAEQRRDIERALETRVFDMYGCHEVPRVASECKHGSMHVADDTVVVQFAPGDGGAQGPQRVLLTSLQAYAMPFVRYDVGDYAHPVDAPCACGLPFGRLSMDMGKVHHIFALPGGERLHTSTLFQPLYALTSLRTFQIRHLALDTIEVAYVAAEEIAHADVERALGVLRRRLGDDVKLHAVSVERIERTGRGKQPIVVSQVAEDTRWTAPERDAVDARDPGAGEETTG